MEGDVDFEIFWGMHVRLLKAGDWRIWRELRLEGLKGELEAFGGSYEEEVKWEDKKFEENLVENDVFGAFDGEGLVGCVGFFGWKLVKTRHGGVVWGLYVKPEYRGKGVGSALMEAVIEHGRQRVMQLTLYCTTNRAEAKKLYEKHGFRVYGVEPRALKIGNQFFDSYCMFLGLS